jgi:hypothetical protein
MASTIADNGQYGVSFTNTTNGSVESNISARGQDDFHLAGACCDTTTVGSDPLGAPVTTSFALCHDQDTWTNWWRAASAGDIDEFVRDGTDDRDTSLVHREPWLWSSSLL